MMMMTMMMMIMMIIIIIEPPCETSAACSQTSLDKTKVTSKVLLK